MIVPIKRLDIAVIGDEDLVSGMRLAGVKRYHMVKDECRPEREVREALRDLLDEPGMGIIVILEEYVLHIGELFARLREGKKLTPMILPVPSKRGTRFADARAYYKDYIRKFIGFDIEV